MWATRRAHRRGRCWGGQTLKQAEGSVSSSGQDLFNASIHLPFKVTLLICIKENIKHFTRPFIVNYATCEQVGVLKVNNLCVFSGLLNVLFNR